MIIDHHKDSGMSRLSVGVNVRLSSSRGSSQGATADMHMLERLGMGWPRQTLDVQWHMGGRTVNCCGLPFATASSWEAQCIWRRQKKEWNLTVMSFMPHMPPCMAKDDKIRTRELMMPQENGIQVDMRK